jgi:maltose alpha-D-glucosyltransferase/alpha-amylase
MSDRWYKNAIIYCLNVESFVDADGDGFGDFQGLMHRLDYLAGLGVTALWLHPFQPSPRRDNGYDVQDFYGVDPRMGTPGDFVEFTHHARQRGIRVLIDLVINHTSNEHPWFQAARRDPRSKFKDYYCWSKERPAHAEKGVVFPGVQKATWSYDDAVREWYHHRFYEFQPDLNIANEEVQEEIRKIMGYWLELGVSGFRVDAVPFVIEENPTSETARKRYDYLRELQDFLQWRTGDAVLLAEANIPPEENERYFGDEGDHMHMIFNFQVNQHLFYALATGDVRPLAGALEATKDKPANSQWATFLRNHDELDLGGLDEEKRERVYEAFAPDPKMRIYDRGIRRRLAPMLGGDRRRIELASSLLFALPGTPVMRYGDEIGMGDDQSLPERMAVRTPMQWSGDRHGGFTLGDKPHVPVISGGPFGLERVNVAAQRRDPGSLLNWTERMIRTRKECPEIGHGEFELLETGSQNVLGLVARWRGEALVSLHNFAAEPRTVTLRIPGSERQILTNLLSEEHSRAGADGRHELALEPYAYRWFRVGPLVDAIRPPSR